MTTTIIKFISFSSPGLANVHDMRRSPTIPEKVATNTLDCEFRKKHTVLPKWWSKERSATMLADNETHYSNGSNGTYNFFFEDPRFISILKRRGTNYTSNIGDAIKFLEDWRRLNMSVVKECERSEYCYGEFRDLILAYNSIHGYVSLLVSVSFYYSTYFKTKFIAFNYVKYHIRFAFPKFIVEI